jgi:hypothetical protein
MYSLCHHIKPYPSITPVPYHLRLLTVLNSNIDGTPPPEFKG